jgi:hypothetical protein
VPRRTAAVHRTDRRDLAGSICCYVTSVVGWRSSLLCFALLARGRRFKSCPRYKVRPQVRAGFGGSPRVRLLRSMSAPCLLTSLQGGGRSGCHREVRRSLAKAYGGSNQATSLPTTQRSARGPRSAVHGSISALPLRLGVDPGHHFPFTWQLPSGIGTPARLALPRLVVRRGGCDRRGRLSRVLNSECRPRARAGTLAGTRSRRVRR